MLTGWGDGVIVCIVDFLINTVSKPAYRKHHKQIDWSKPRSRIVWRKQGHQRSINPMEKKKSIFIFVLRERLGLKVYY